MTNSMKDLLLGLGFKPAPRAEPAKPQQARPQHGRPPHGKPQQRPAGAPGREPARQAESQAGHPRHPRPQIRPPRTREEMDLGKAYALRAQREKDERIEAERLKQEAARIKREAKSKVAELLKDKALNDAAAELTRHFDYNGKIRRVHVNETQLKALNAGELGVVQLDGRYLLVDSALAREVQALLPSLLALLIDPDAPATDDPYADPKYAVPDDMVW